MRNFPPHATMPRLALVHRFIDAMLPLIDTTSVTGQHLTMASTALANADLITALLNLDSAVATGFAQGYETRSPEAWIAAVAAPMLRP